MIFRSQPHRIQWPLTPTEVEGIDEMLQILFKQVQLLSTGVNGLIADVGGIRSFEPSFIIPGATGADGDSIYGIPGVDGVRGLTGESVFIPGATGDDGAPGLFIPAIDGKDGRDGVPGANGENADDSIWMPEIWTPAELRCSAYGSATQDIVTATFVAATLDAEDYDLCTMHDNVTNNTRITAPEAGYYLITGGAQFANSAAGQRVAIPKLNGTTFLPGGMRFAVNGATTTSNALVSVVWLLAAGDYIELMIFQDTGGNLTTGSATRFAANFLQLNRLNYR